MQQQKINQIKWNTIDNLQLSESGSSGVIIVNTQTQKLALKISGEAGLDLFISKLSQLCGIKVPDVKILSQFDPELYDLCEHILKFSEKDEVLHHRMKSKLQMEFIQVMEFIEGLHITEFGLEKAKLIFKDKNRMIELGKLYAFDIFLNNGDRLPLEIWDNQGNIENCILKVNNPDKKFKDISFLDYDYDMFYGIDPRIILKSDSQNQVQEQIIKSYYQSIEHFLEKLFHDFQLIEKKKTNCFDLLDLSIKNNTLYELDNEAHKNLMIGIIIQMNQLSHVGMDKIVQLRDSLLISDDIDYLGNFNRNLRRINVEFHQGVLDIYKKYLNDHKELIDKIIL